MRPPAYLRAPKISASSSFRRLKPSALLGVHAAQAAVLVGRQHPGLMHQPGGVAPVHHGDVLAGDAARHHQQVVQVADARTGRQPVGLAVQGDFRRGRHDQAAWAHVLGGFAHEALRGGILGKVSQ
jgi:hypothetical protein